MIEELRIRDLGVISEAVLRLRPGLTVITGETGAGKTMLLTSIDLVMGGRPDTSRVRPGSQRAEAEAVLMVPRDSETLERLEELGADLDDGALIVSRVVPAEGRARALLGGRSVPAAVLGEVVGAVVAVHGQGEQQRLGRSDVQREILDRVGGESTIDLRERYRGLVATLREVERERLQVLAHGAERAAEAARLTDLLAQVDALLPEAGEEESLATEAVRLEHSEALRQAADRAHEALSADESDIDALGLVAGARRALEQERQHDPALGAIADALGSASAALADAAADLASYAASVEADPARLEAVHRRRADLSALGRRYGATVDELVVELPHLRQRLAALSDDEGTRAALDAEIARLRGEIGPVALALAQQREAAAAGLGEKVAAELSGLAMPHARVEWRVEVSEGKEGAAETIALPDGRLAVLGAWGVDEVTLLLAAHPDAPALPLARAASGGEMSRVMLALEVALAGADPVPTMVFDEVDAGVGGRAAVEVGRRLAALGRTAQVLVVTHLPQVAAFADQHLVVLRSDTAEVTTSDVVEVEGDDRVRELARMLAGFEDSTSAADHARELLQLAAEMPRVV